MHSSFLTLFVLLAIAATAVVVWVVRSQAQHMDQLYAARRVAQPPTNLQRIRALNIRRRGVVRNNLMMALAALIAFVSYPLLSSQCAIWTSYHSVASFVDLPIEEAMRKAVYPIECEIKIGEYRLWSKRSLEGEAFQREIEELRFYRGLLLASLSCGVGVSCVYAMRILAHLRRNGMESA